MAQIQRHYVITTTDKNPHAFSYICKRHYISTLATELDGPLAAGNNGAHHDGAYEATASTKQQVVHQWAQFYGKVYNKKMPPAKLKRAADKNDNAQVQVPKPEPALPHAFTTTKYHKNPIGHRFVAGAGAAISTRLSQNINRALVALMPDLNNLWKSTLKTLPHTLHAGTSKSQRRKRAAISDAIEQCWIVHSTSDLRDTLDALNRDTSQPHRQAYTRGQASRTFKKNARWGVYDFSTLYTTLPHNHRIHGLKQRMKQLLGDIFGQPIRQGQQLVVSWNQDRTGWRTGKNNRPPVVKQGEMTVTAARLSMWINQLVDHCYIEFGKDVLRHQTVGLPMGEPCSGALANCYLFTYERQFMARLVNSGKRRRQYTKRTLGTTPIQHGSQPSSCTHGATLTTSAVSATTNSRHTGTSERDPTDTASTPGCT